ncbi:DUF1800 domain-containing protein [Ulvibacter antarcticus]|uniref:Uncharacterized protein (DUF1800 family) n=1 Tax=Ulvibacter antarcticus TaxID=442714 RepID=A0A3L9ZHI7_9FLAO|nr:DUF1800 domain-containing protein [Ulvibacter antarcticus]RMA66172.1 uncharacterized protein (DUF1800 family) [Ulvibacter antarcticus]
MITATPPSCNDASIAPFIPTTADPWNTTKVTHAYRRLGFGASQQTIDAALAMSPGDFIDMLVDTAFNLPTTPAPPWGYYSYNDFTDYENQNFPFFNEWRIQTVNDFMNEDLRGRMTFFWMNHFVTEFETYGHSPYAFQYYNTMQFNCVGNFKQFVRAVGVNSTMLIYLNGFQNTQFDPNENFARELFELFTLGEGNGYTQEDIVETARALTGYNHWNDYGDIIYFDPSTFDSGEKTIFGQTGEWGYDDVINLLFQERGEEIAFYICEKLYRFFVSPAVDAVIEQDIIQPLVDTFINNDFEIVPVLKQLFKSEHFFNERALGVTVKSPYDVILAYLKETGFYYDDELIETIVYYNSLMGQDIYDPPDVSGWQRDETWINSSTLTGRWQLVDLYIWFLFDQNEFTLTDLARDLTNDSIDPNYITQVLVDHFMAKPLHSPLDYTIATDIFKWDVPQNYYDEGLWNLSWSSAPYQVLLLLQHIGKMPEFQLK